MKTTTLQSLRDNNACQRGYHLIANHVGVDFTGEIPLETILDNNGLSDCIWSLRTTDEGKEIAQEFAIRVAMKGYFKKSWVNWANNWLDGSDRSESAAYAAYADADAYAAAAAAYAAYADADAYAAYAAAAAYAAYADADAAAALKKMQSENIELLRSLIK